MAKMIRPTRPRYIELTDLERNEQILQVQLGGASHNLLYNPKTDRWEWAMLSSDYLQPYSPYSGAYREITEAEILAKYPTALQALDKPIDETVPVHWNDVAPEAIDPYGSYS
ncbi:MAG: hypothetical protein LBC43_03990 [Bifidobacteriaceae bacterium]|jgi:hypothetical protein|nr:hypothetical protein [Bifidobacteriaceae bacterium]